MLSRLGTMLGHFGAMLSQLGVRLGDLGAMLGLCWAILEPCWAYVGRSWGHLGPMLGLCWAILGLILGHVGPSWDEKSAFVEEQKTAKNTANCGATHRSAAGAGSPIAKASGLRPGALPEYRACWPDRGRAPAADPPLKSFSLLGFSRFWVFGMGKKIVKFEDAFWRSLLGVFWSIFSQFSAFFGTVHGQKSCNLQCFCAFGIQKKLLTTCRKLRKYQCFC